MQSLLGFYSSPTLSTPAFSTTDRTVPGGCREPRLEEPVKLATRGLAVIVGSATLAVATTLAVSAPAAAAPATTTTKATTTHACDQDVTPGHYACMALRRTDLGFTPRSAISPQATAQLIPS